MNRTSRRTRERNQARAGLSGPVAVNSCNIRVKGALLEEMGGVRGENLPELRRVKALSGVMKRDYAYDMFWLVFPLVDEEGELLFPGYVEEAEPVVRIYDKVGRVDWEIPPSIRDLARAAGSAE